MAQGLSNEALLYFVEGHANRKRHGFCRSRGRLRDHLRKIVEPQRVSSTQDHGALDRILELSHVTGPRIIDQFFLHVARDDGPRTTILLAVERKEMVHEQRDIFPSLT